MKLARLLLSGILSITWSASSFAKNSTKSVGVGAVEKIEKAPSLKEQNLKDLFSALNPSRDNETLIELLYRLDVYLDEKNKTALYNNLGEHSDVVLAKVEVKDTEAWFGEGKNRVHLKGEIDKKNQIKFFINNQEFVPKNVSSMGETLKELTIHFKKTASKKTSLMKWFQFVIPQAHASSFIDDIPWGTVLPIAAIGLVGWYAIDAKKKNDEAARVQAEANACPMVCCGSPSQNSFGQIVGGAFSTRMGTCCQTGTLRVAGNYCCASTVDASASPFCAGVQTASSTAPTGLTSSSAGAASVPFSPAAKRGTASSTIKAATMARPAAIAKPAAVSSDGQK